MLTKFVSFSLPFLTGRGILKVKVTNSLLAWSEFAPCTAYDLPSRRRWGMLIMSKIKHITTGVVWTFREKGIHSALSSSVEHASKFRGSL
ncbi:hypothetical protein TNCV_4148961 [Trichonephila clavipes]|nr:hypothetical protein TNCV_4148961 [Trichonephila clavipes]